MIYANLPRLRNVNLSGVMQDYLTSAGQRPPVYINIVDYYIIFRNMFLQGR